MEKRIMQFRYYADPTDKNKSSANNQPPELDADMLSNGTAFNDISNITQLGVQTLPGVRFYLNNAEPASPIIIGSTGIYELDLEGISQINEIHFEGNSLKKISTNPNAYLIIDMICELKQQEE